ncbi:MAG: hypothetical protein HY556_02835 [Euryarchaeota archaeon]|nr:hypothetical protein [Euryarchaeota archaeon]
MPAWKSLVRGRVGELSETSHRPLIVAVALVGWVVVAGSAQAGNFNEQIGPINLLLISNGDPIHSDYDEGESPGAGDDSVNLVQNVALVSVRVDNRWGAFAAVPLIPSIDYGVNFQESTIDYPLFRIANETDEENYDSRTSAEQREQFDVEFNRYTYKVNLSARTPFGKFDVCPDPRCAPPYGVSMEYDQIHFPAGIYNTSVEAFINATEYMFENTRIRSTPLTPESRVGNHTSFPDGAVRDLAPEVAVGYTLHRGEAVIGDGHGGPQDDATPVGFTHSTVNEDGISARLPASTYREDSPGFGVRSSFLMGSADGAAAASKSTTPALPSAPAPMPKIPLVAWAAAAMLVVLPFILFLYHRLRPEGALEHTVRRRLYEQIRRAPGIRQAALAECLGIKRELVDYHARRLQEIGLIVVKEFGRDKRFFENGGTHNEASQVFHAFMQSHRARQIIQFAYLRPGVDQRLLARLVGVHESTIKWHVDRLSAAAVLRVERLGRKKGIHVESAFADFVSGPPPLSR